ncbi:MAG: SDR family oxidoreductase [bacterium]|nr:SDR family oxidoreductase [bacterium]
MTHTLITGASAGLGLELARLFASDGHPLVLVARSEDKLRALAETLRRDYEIDVRVLPADLSEPGAADYLAAHLIADGPGIRHLVNNAGVGAYGPFGERSWDVDQRMIQLNVTALVGLTHLLLPSLRAGDGYRGILNVSSTAGFQPGPLMAVYFATKAFVTSFSEALHEELRGTGVHVTAFLPGPTKTNFCTTNQMIPAGVVADDGTVDEAALVEFKRREAKRMDAGEAARAGYEGYLTGKAMVIPGRRNQLLSMVPRVVPRMVVRRMVHGMMKK